MNDSAVKNRRKRDMINGPFTKKIILFALPILLSGILQLFYNSADLIIVGRFSVDAENAQGAISSTSSLIHLIINAFMGIAVGVNVACARRIGAGDENGTHRVVHTAVSLSFICGIVVAIAGYFLSGQFLIWMKSPNGVIELSTLYLKIYFLGTPFLLFYEFCAGILRAKGETQKPLIFLLISGAINVILNFILVFFFHMSVAGVGIATVISEAISAILILIYLLRTDDACRLKFSKLRIYGKELGEIVLIGLPAGIQGSMFSISNVTIQSSINSFGNTVVAGIGNAANIESYLNTLVNCIVQAAISFIGQNYGAKRKKNIITVMKICLLLMTITCLIASGLTVLLRYQLLAIYNDSLEVIEAGIPRILINGSFYILFGYMQLVVGFMRGLGKGILPMIISICGICVFRVIWVFAVLPHFNTIICLFISYPISWALTALAQMLCLLIFKNKSFEKMNNQPSIEAQ